MPSSKPAVYLHLFHGRDTDEEQPEDWGYAGPSLGPLRYVHGTYSATLRCLFVNPPEVTLSQSSSS